MLQRIKEIDGVAVPRLMYGTAWKEEKTARLTETALRAGFRGVDTANQRKHYDEVSVGRALSSALNYGVVRRDQLFVQSKYTFRASQDFRLPYDPDAPIGQQVEQSFASSCRNLGLKYLNGYLLHGPTLPDRLAPPDWEAWRAIERIHEQGGARLIGVSNVSLAQLDALCQDARVVPRIVQNRCHAHGGWDTPVRSFCAENGIAYQGFSVLTGSPTLLRCAEVVQMAKRMQKTVGQVVLRYALDLGIVVLTGTTSPQHMHHDLDVFDFELPPGAMVRIDDLAAMRG